MHQLTQVPRLALPGDRPSGVRVKKQKDVRNIVGGDFLPDCPL